MCLLLISTSVLQSFVKTADLLNDLLSINKRDTNSQDNLHNHRKHNHIKRDSIKENNQEKNTIFRFQEEEILIKSNKSDTSESENDLDNDFDCYKEVLYSIGDFSKYSLDYCLPVLSK